jgi:cell division protein FtsB
VREWLVPLISTLLGGTLLQGLVLLLRAGAERQSVVAGGAERAVLSLERSLAHVERERDRLAARVEQLEAELTTYRKEHS